MATLYDIKPRFQALLRPLVRRLATAGVTANQVTLLAAALSVALGSGLWLRPSCALLWIVVPVWMLLRMALNAIDGMLAREHAMKTPLGALLNELSDVVADAALYLPFALLPGVFPALVVGLVLLGTIGEMTGVVAVQIGATRRYDGPFGKSDRALFFGVIALVAGLRAPLAAWVNYALALALLFSVRTIINRARGALHEISN